MKTRNRMLKKAKKLGWKVVYIEQHNYLKQAAEQTNKILETYLSLETDEERAAMEKELGWK